MCYPCAVIMVSLAQFIMAFSLFYISSDTGTKPPESCVFGLLLNMAAALCKFSLILLIQYNTLYYIVYNTIQYIVLYYVVLYCIALLISALSLLSRNLLKANERK